MSLGYYRLIKGKLSVRQRQSPDGDSMRFLPDDASHLADLPRYQAPDEVGGLESFQLRFQAIDAPDRSNPFGSSRTRGSTTGSTLAGAATSRS